MSTPQRPPMVHRRTSTGFLRDPLVSTPLAQYPDTPSSVQRQAPAVPPVATASPFHTASAWSIRRPFEFESTPNMNSFSAHQPIFNAGPSTPRRPSDEDTLYSPHPYGPLADRFSHSQISTPPTHTMRSRNAVRGRRQSYGFVDGPGSRRDSVFEDDEKSRSRAWSNDFSVDMGSETQPQSRRFPASFNLLDHYRASHTLQRSKHDRSDDALPSLPSGTFTIPPSMQRVDSSISNESEGLDMDDPLVTGVRKSRRGDPADLEEICKRQIGMHGLDYKARRKENKRITVQKHVTCTFLTCIALGDVSF